MPPAQQQQAAGSKRSPELADIFRAYGESYRQAHPLPRAHLKVMRAIESCRTAALGGHLRQCDSCGYQQPAYNSCRNRHCPKCGALAKAQWLEDRKADLLPVGYFHLVFTLPHELNPLMLVNKKRLCDILFKSVSQTLLEFGRTHLHGSLGFICVLHTWDQRLRDHFHLHCLIPGGALSFDGTQWIAARQNFLFSVKALSLVFRGKFLALLEQASLKEQLQFPGRTAALAEPTTFSNLVSSLRSKQWVVYAKRPFSSPEKVLDYLGRYTHRVALSNNRILAVTETAEGPRVTFSYRDRKHGDCTRTMTLRADEFIRRFLLHVLPNGFMRIRHFGFLANRSRKLKLDRCRKLLDFEPPSSPARKSARQLMLEVTGFDLALCPACHLGTLINLHQLPVIDIVPGSLRGPPLDSS
ncbi:MAG TPA: IS91 family transposase [Terriglobales bacterium]|nr:IS91 family transposase [Terriglobales bacterium]